MSWLNLGWNGWNCGFGWINPLWNPCDGPKNWGNLAVNPCECEINGIGGWWNSDINFKGKSFCECGKINSPNSEIILSLPSLLNLEILLTNRIIL